MLAFDPFERVVNGLRRTEEAPLEREHDGAQRVAPRPLLRESAEGGAIRFIDLGIRESHGEASEGKRSPDQGGGVPLSTTGCR